MKKCLLFAFILCATTKLVQAQGLHFSQFNNAPLLTNPSNTGLMHDADYRVGVNFRNQWNTIPVKFTTFSAFGDIQLKKDNDANGWFGIGGAIFSDKAGDGILSLTQGQLTVAYHQKINYSSMISVGFGGAFMQRSLDFNKMSYDMQWNGFGFNTGLPNGENNKNERTSYADVSAGVSYAVFPHEDLFAKFGFGLMHVNRATESFYEDKNKLGLRPTIGAEVIYKFSKDWIIHPSVYGSMQKGSYELIIGTDFAYNISKFNSNRPTIFSMGVYYRLQDAVIASVAYEFAGLKMQFSYDVTTSGLSKANNSNGAFEFSLIYKGLFGRNQQSSKGGFNCPRF